MSLPLQSLHDVSQSSPPRPAPAPAHLGGVQFDAMFIFDWIEAGWRAARAQPLLWLGTWLACAAFGVACKFIPLLRPTVVLIAPLAVGVLMVAQERLRVNRPASPREIAAAIAQRVYPLLAIGLASASLIIVGYALSAIVLDASILESFVTNGVHRLSIVYGGAGPKGTVATLVALPIFTVALAAAWFAPALVLLRGAGPLDAMAASLLGAARNWRTTSIYVVAFADAVLLAGRIPLLLSSATITPLVLLSIYGSYRDVFAAPTSYAAR